MRLSEILGREEVQTLVNFTLNPTDELQDAAQVAAVTLQEAYILEGAEPTEAIHYAVFLGREYPGRHASCGGEQGRATTDRVLVDCRDCLRVLSGEQKQKKEGRE